MTKESAKTLARFVTQRLSEGSLPPPVQQTYRSVFELSAKVRKDGESDDLVSWFTGGPALKAAEYIFGADPASSAEKFSDQLRASIAQTWSDHPDYDPAWNALVPAAR